MTGDGVNDARLEARQHRRRHGHHRHRCGQADRRHGAHRRQLRQHRRRIEQGRIIYSNIRKFVYFLLACNVGNPDRVSAMMVGMPIPLRPVQLLWLNLVSDGARARPGAGEGDRTS